MLLALKPVVVRHVLPAESVYAGPVVTRTDVALASSGRTVVARERGGSELTPKASAMRHMSGTTLVAPRLALNIERAPLTLLYRCSISQLLTCRTGGIYLSQA